MCSVSCLWFPRSPLVLAPVQCRTTIEKGRESKNHLSSLIWLSLMPWARASHSDSTKIQAIVHVERRPSTCELQHRVRITGKAIRPKMAWEQSWNKNQLSQKKQKRKEKSKTRGAKRDSNRMRIRGVVSLSWDFGGKGGKHRWPHVRIPTLYYGLLPLLPYFGTMYFLLVYFGK